MASEVPALDLKSKQAEGVLGGNASFSSYEQVPKPSYNLTEAADGADAFDDAFQFEVVDISALMANPDDPKEIKAVADKLGPALQTIGFAIITGHGVAESLLSETHAAVQSVFTSTPQHVKNRFTAARKGSVNQGYFNMEETSNLHPDQVEGWVFCRRAFEVPGGAGCNGNSADLNTFWPETSLEPFFRSLIQQEWKMVQPIVRSILSFLGEDDVHKFDGLLRESNFGFRLNYYPPLSDAAVENGTGRMLGHEDVDLFTLLPASAVEGLQVLKRDTGKWVRLMAPPGSIIINVGDYLQRITNDVLPSTTHRVAPPRDHSLRKQCRTSFPLAVYINEKDMLTCLPSCGEPKYKPESAIDFHTAITSKYYGEHYRRDNGED